jgi:hypothetical protein
MKTYSTRQAAAQLGITGVALGNYIKSGKVPEPQIMNVGGRNIHMWTDAEIQDVRQLLPKIANGRKTRYKKKQLAVSTHGSPGQAQQSRQARDRSAKAKGKTRSKKKK